MRITASPSGPAGDLRSAPGGSGDRDPVLSGLSLDSRQVRPGFLFAALAGNRQDGAAFVADAVRRGATPHSVSGICIMPPDCSSWWR